MLKKLLLCDQSKPMVDAFKSAFAGERGVSTRTGDILRCGCDAIVSPGNSFGDMGGGVDKHIDDATNGAAQRAVTEAIRRRYLGELPVGSAMVLDLGLRRLKFLVVAPTMRVPGNVRESINAYLAFRAALLCVQRYNEAHDPGIRSLAVSGLCTSVGGMDPEDSARQMHAAFRSVVRGEWKAVMHPAMAPYALRE